MLGKFILSFALVLMVCQTHANDYISGKAGKKEAALYSKASKFSLRYLGYRDLQPWLDLVQGREALDYGTGVGESIKFLLAKKFKVTGVDINSHMIALAKKSRPKAKIVLAKDKKLSFADKSFDLVFSSFVLFELKSKEEILNYLTQARLVLKDNGYFIGITASPHMYDPLYKSTLRYSDFPQNYNAKSGELVKVKSHELGITFSDYLWFEHDYREIFEHARLPICSVQYPLGKEHEGYHWLDETTISPLLVILAAKDCEAAELSLGD